MSSFVVHAVSGSMCTTLSGCRQLLEIRKEDGRDTHSVIVVSPVRGDGKALCDLIDDAVHQDEKLWAEMERLFQARTNLIEDLLPQGSKQELLTQVKKGFGDIEDILRAVWLVGDASSGAKRYIDRIETLWLLEAVKGIFSEAGYQSKVLIDAKQIPAEISLKESKYTTFLATGDSSFEKTAGCNFDDRFVSCEYIAAKLANQLNAKKLTYWNMHNLVTTADPEEVPAAKVIEKISYAEATELSFFGARLLHPQSMVPAIAKSIPIHIRAFEQIQSQGTCISQHNGSDPDKPVKGFSVIHNTSLINIEGAGMIGVPGISSRLFAAIREAGISVILISQASSEHSICFAVPCEQAALAALTARQAFTEELREQKINSIDVEDRCAILAAVGENMPGVPGIAAKFFGALGKAGVNVRAIAQGSSELNISAVIQDRDSKKALRALHAAFFLSNQALSVGVFGPGLIGGTLIDQVSREIERLKVEFGVDIRIRGIANSKRMIISEQGIDLNHWRDDFLDQAIPLDMENFVAHVAADYFPHSVIIDCTTSSILPKSYLSWIKQGIHIITPNKKAGTAELDYYHDLMHEGRRHGKHFLYETTVGAGLPIIGTLKDLIQTGDRVHKIEGVLSGTLAYLFWRYDGSVPFSTLVHEAKQLGFTEPDPRDDLSGMDIVRKTVILAREIGIPIEVEDVPVKSLVPAELLEVEPEEFLRRLDIMDEEMLKLYNEAQNEGKVLKYVGMVDRDGSCSVALRGYPLDHPFARITGTDNIVAFTTDRYQQQPLVIQGPGAGPEVTAGGVFGDLLRLSAYLGAKF